MFFSRMMSVHDSTRLRTGLQRLSAPGVFAVSQLAPIGQVIEDLLIPADCSLPGEWEGQVRYVPL